MSTGVNGHIASVLYPEYVFDKKEQNQPDEPEQDNVQYEDQQQTTTVETVSVDDKAGVWRSADDSSLIGNATFDNSTSDEDEDVYGSERFVYASLEMSEDQQQATAELYNLKLDLGFNAGESSSILDYTERIRKLNEDLLNDPIPADMETRERSIKFKEALVDFIAPTPDLDLFNLDSELLKESSAQVEEYISRSSLTPSHFTVVQNQTEHIDQPVNHDLADVDIVQSSNPCVGDSEPEKTLEVSQAVQTVGIPQISSEIISSVTVDGMPHKSSEMMPSVAVDEDGNGLVETAQLTLVAEDQEAAQSQELNGNESFEGMTFIEQNGKFRVATSYDLSAVEASQSDNTLEALREQSETKFLHPRPPFLHPRPPATPRAPTTEYSYRGHQRRASARQPGSARTAGSTPGGAGFRSGQSASSACSINSNQTESSRSAGPSRVRSSRNTVSKSMDNDQMRAVEEDDRKRKKRIASATAFRAWLRKKKAESEAKQATDPEQSNQSTNGAANKSEGKPSFDEWLRMKEAQKKREHRLQEAERNYLSTHSPRGTEADRAFRQWLRRKQQEKVYQKEIERQRSTLHSLMSRRSRKSIALARAIHQAQALRLAEYWTPHGH